MIEEARRKGFYDWLAVGDIAAFLAGEHGRERLHLVDRGRCVRLYCRSCAEVCAAVARVLDAGGLFAFTVETHAGEGAIVGAKMRYAHGADFVRARDLRRRGCHCVDVDAASTRTENRVPVPGLLVLARR